MKKSLPVFIFLFFTYASIAQTVLVRDSVLTSSQNNPFKFYEVQEYLYNNDCKVQSITSPSYVSTYTYYSSGKIYELTGLYYNSDSGAYINSNRSVFVYNGAGKTTSNIYQNWNSDSGRFINSSKIDYTFTSDTILDHSYSSQWDGMTGTWVLKSEAIYYTSTSNQTDSVITYDYYVANVQSVSKTYTTYYTNIFLKYVSRTYNYTDNVFTGMNRNSYYHDSTNYLQRDSVIFETLYDTTQAPSRVITYGFLNIFSTDGNISETVSNNYYRDNNNNNSVTSTKTYHFYGPCSSVLPIMFLDFKGSLRDKDVILTWQTANATNTSAFAIQRSTDGIHFTTIGNVAVNSQGNSYSYIDKSAGFLPTSKLFYRLAERDKDGSLQYSNIALLNKLGGKVLITASPNPATSLVKVYSFVTLNDAVITVSDTRGRLVYSANQNIPAGSSVPVDVSAFANGMYIITIQSSSYKQQIKIVKE